MNHYRFRLVLATASLTAALTVLALKLGGFISQPGREESGWTVSRYYSGQGLSPYRLDCAQHLAKLARSDRAEGPPLRLFDHKGRVIACDSNEQPDHANQ